MKKPSLFEIFKTALYVGVIGYGGAANLALMKKIFVHDKKWISENDFMEALSLAQIIPGSTGVSLMGNIGFRFYRILGGILIPIAYMLPATTAILILSWAYFYFGNVSFVQSLFVGLGALVVALLVNATWMLGKSVFKNITIKDWKGFAIAIVTFIGVFFLKINVIYLILTAGTLGFIFYYFTKEFEGEKIKGGEVLLSEPTTSAWRLMSTKDWISLLVLFIFVGIGFIIPSIRDLFATFVKIGLFAFGGGFAVIPLIQNQVVTVHSWLSNKEFIDGLALGQITPGPVLVTATFVGYRVAGILGALFSTLAIFLIPIISMIALADIHAKVRNLRIVKVVVKGFLAGFIGLLVAITLQFAFKSLMSWQAWFIFIPSLFWLMYLKKDAIWAILATIVLSLLIFN
jgi:chromate transporter